MTQRLWRICLGWVLIIGLGACAHIGRVTPYELGVALQDEGNFPAAIEHYKEVLDSNPRHLRARFNLAVIYHDQHEYDRAKEQYQRLLSSYPHHARSLVNLADIALAEGNAAQAYVLLLRAVDTEPDRAYPYSFLGRYLQQQGKLAKAQEAYEHALDIEDNALTRYRLGVLFLQQGDASKARQQFEHAIDLDANEPHALYQLALLAIKDDQADEAVRYLQRLTFLTPRNAQVFLLLGRLLLQQQQYIRAALHLWEARDLQPDLPDVEALLLQTYEGLVRQQRAIVGPPEPQKMPPENPPRLGTVRVP